MRRLLVLVLLGCGATLNADPGKCAPACGSGLACCSEPTHSPDGGPRSAFVCVTPSNGACPLQP